MTATGLWSLRDSSIHSFVISLRYIPSLFSSSVCTSVAVSSVCACSVCAVSFLPVSSPKSTTSSEAGVSSCLLPHAVNDNAATDIIASIHNFLLLIRIPCATFMFTMWLPFFLPDDYCYSVMPDCWVAVSSYWHNDRADSFESYIYARYLYG